MTNSRNIILVGASNVGKSKFHSLYTKSTYQFPTNNVIYGIATLGGHLMVIIDTPGEPKYRNDLIYSWEGVFKNIELIVNFGDWTINEIYGIPPSKLPAILTWSGQDDETMKRIIDNLQKKCSLSPGFSLDSLWGC